LSKLLEQSVTSRAKREKVKRCHRYRKWRNREVGQKEKQEALLVELAEEVAEAVCAAGAPEVRQQLLDASLKKHQRQLPALSVRKWKRLYLDPSLLNHKRRSSRK